jgi:hypothetical protein
MFVNHHTPPTSAVTPVNNRHGVVKVKGQHVLGGIVADCPFWTLRRDKWLSEKTVEPDAAPRSRG